MYQNPVRQVDMASVSQRLASMQQQILSRSRLESLIHQFGLYSGGPNKVPIDGLIERFQKGDRSHAVQPTAETGDRYLPGFTVNVTLANPRTAQAVCTAVTSMFIGNDRVQQQHAEQTTQFLSAQLVEAKADLDAQDAKLAAFKGRYIGSLPDDEQTNLNLLTGLTSQLDATNQALARAQQDKSFAQSMLTQQLAAWQATQSGRNPDTLEQQLATMQTQLASLELRYTDDYPDVIKAKRDVAAAKENRRDWRREDLLRPSPRSPRSSPRKSRSGERRYTRPTRRSRKRQENRNTSRDRSSSIRAESNAALSSRSSTRN